MNFSKVDYGKNTGLKSDSTDFEKQSEAPLKYYTTNWAGALKTDAGINFVEGFGKPAGFTDVESQLIRSTVTNPRVRQNFDALPFATTGGLPSSGPVISEEISRELRSCQPMENEFYKRHFYTLDGYKPQAEITARQGKDTRQDNRF